MSKPLPCPWHGDEDVSVHEQWRSVGSVWRVECWDGCCGPWEESSDEAITRWNVVAVQASAASRPNPRA